MSQFLRNTSGQRVGFSAVDLDGEGKTSGVDVYVTIDGGTRTAAAGTATHKGNGSWDYAFTQAETDGVCLVLDWGGTGVVPGSLTIYTTTKLVSSLNDITAASVWSVTTRTLSAIDASIISGNISGTVGGIASVTFPFGFNNLTLENINAQVDAALADYDAPTHSELTSALGSLASHGDEHWTTATGFAMAEDMTLGLEGIGFIYDILMDLVVADLESETFQFNAHALALAPTGSGGGGGGIVLGFHLDALKQLAQTDTTLEGASPGSVAALAQGAGALSDAQQQQLDNIEEKTSHITAGRVQLITPLVDGGRTAVLIRGDTYSDASPHGPLVWKPREDADWPDLTDATATFTVRLASSDAIEMTTTQGVEIVNPAGPDKQIKVTLSAAMTQALTPSLKSHDHKFDLQITLSEGVIWTPIRGGDNLRSGGMTVIEDQTRPAPSE